MAKTVECLPSKPEALSSNCNTTKKKKQTYKKRASTETTHYIKD
jgi:hypothetical protein